MIEKLFLYLYVFSLPLINMGVFKAFFEISLGVGIMPAYIIILVLSYVLIIKYLTEGNKHGIIITPSPINKILLLFFMALVVSLVMNYFVPVSEFRGEVPIIKSLKQITFWGFMIFNYFILISAIREIKTFKMVLTVHIIASFFVSIFGMLQFFNFTFNIPWIDTANEYFSTSDSFSTVNATVTFADYTSNLGRIRSTTPEPLVFANYLLTAIPFVFANMISKKKFLLIPNWFNMLILITTITSFVLTFSKGGYLALIVGFFIAVAVTWQYGNIGKFLRYSLAVTGLVSIIFYLIVILFIGIEEGGTFFLDNIIQLREIFTIGGPENLSIATRRFSIVASLNIFLHYPVLGVGIGNYVFYYYAFAPSGGEIAQFYLPTANNLFLQVFAESGILGGGLLILIIWFLIKEIKIVYSIIDIPEARFLNVAFVFSGSAVLIQLLSVSAYTWPHLWFLMALFVVYKNILQKTRSERKEICV